MLKFTEDSRVKIPSILHLTRLGYGYLSKDNAVWNESFNILTTTGTNVFILFLDKANTGDVVLLDASGLGTKVKEGKNKTPVLSSEEEQKIIDTFNNKEAF